MKKLILATTMILLVGCSAYKPKRTEFYKNGVLQKTFVGRGIYDGNESFGYYKIWALHDWAYFEYTCRECAVVETVLPEVK